MEKNTPIIDLFGWDTAFVVTFEYLNYVISNQKSTPKSFYLQNVKKEITTAEIKGNWSDWSITTGSDGQNLSMKCPISDGKFNDYINDEEIELANTWIEIELKLTFLEQMEKTFEDKTSVSNTGTQFNLQVLTQKSDSDSEIISIKDLGNIDFSKSSDPIVTEGIFKAVFTKWFEDNLNLFNQVFACLLINSKAAVDHFQWLKPTSMQYAMSSTGDLKSSVLGVMCMTENRVNTRNTHSVDARILDITNTNSAFVISGERFATKWLLPGCLSIHIGTREDDFMIDQSGLAYMNINDLECQQFQISEDEIVNPIIKAGSFSAKLDYDCIKLTFEDLYWPSSGWRDWGLIIHINYSERYKLALKSGVDPNNVPYKNVLTMEDEGKAKCIVTIEKTEKRTIAEFGIEIGINIISTVLGSLLGGVIGGALSKDGEAAVESGIQKAAEEGADSIPIEITEELEAGEAAIPEDVKIGQIEETGLDTENDLNIQKDELERGTPISKIGQILREKKTSIKNYFKKNKFKLAGSMVGGIAGIPLSYLPNLIDKQVHDRYSELPTMDTYVANCIGNVRWPNASGFDLENCILAGVLLLGGSLTEEGAKS